MLIIPVTHVLVPIKLLNFACFYGFLLKEKGAGMRPLWNLFSFHLTVS
jgi:hypothetical protein